jgi:imidazolonepropionase-like amidohydrolase
MKLLNARLIDGKGGVSERVDITLEDNRFGEISASAEHASAESTNPQMHETLDLSGKTVIPGLFNCHIHMIVGPFNRLEEDLNMTSAYRALLSIKRMETMLKAGITTARDLGGADYTEMEVKKVINAGLFKGPRLLVSGKVLTMTGGHGHWIGHEVDGIDAAKKAARLNIKMGADCIKMMATGGVMTPGVEPSNVSLDEEELRAGFNEAHKAGKLSASHAQGNAGIKNAIRAGVRTIEHGVFLDDEAINMMLERGTFLVPTLAAPYQIADAGLEKGVPKYMVDKSLMILEIHRHSTEMAIKAGVKIAAGNDGGTPYNPHEDILTELKLYTEAGMSNLEAITSATSVAAEAMKLDGQVGTVEKGKLADFVVLEADPLADLYALKTPAMVWKEGQRAF